MLIVLKDIKDINRELIKEIDFMFLDGIFNINMSMRSLVNL